MRRLSIIPAAVLCLAALPLARAETVRIHPVGDSVLAQMRGRGIPGETITGFRLVVVSTWDGGAGSLSAGSTVQVTGLQGGQPQVQVGSAAGGSGAFASSPGGITGGALQVQGLGQLTQVAGDGNQGHNSFVLRLVPDDTSLPGVSGGPLNASFALGGSQATVSADGHGGVQVAISTPLGQALQRVGNGSVSQSLSIAGNSQLVANSAELTVLTHPAGGLAGLTLLRQMQNMMPTHP